MSPFDLDLDAAEVYGDEDDYGPEFEESEVDALERQAIIQEHVVMAQGYARK